MVDGSVLYLSDGRVVDGSVSLMAVFNMSDGRVVDGSV